MAVKRFFPVRFAAAFASLLMAVLALSVAAKPPQLILPDPSLLRAQQLLRQAEQTGAARVQPGLVLKLQEKINAAWSAYHLQVEEKADKPDDEEAVLARYLAEEAELDAELLLITMQTLADEARLDAVHRKLGRVRPERLEVPSLRSRILTGESR